MPPNLPKIRSRDCSNIELNGPLYGRLHQGFQNNSIIQAPCKTMSEGYSTDARKFGDVILN